VLFTILTLRGLAEGRIDRTYRRWSTVRPKVGSRFTTKVGVVEVTSIDLVDPSELDSVDAQRAGFESLAALAKWTSAKGEGDLYEIGISLVGPDPRVALRTSAALSDAEFAALEAKLNRMDRAAETPWTHAALRLIERNPGVVSTELAAEAGEDRPYFKLRIRRLKALGLTESLTSGYLLSPRGAAYLARLESS
jgi:hypothetical protein